MIKSRYGGKTHIIVLVFGLFTNIIVTLSLLLGGTAVLTGLVQVIVYFVTKRFSNATFCEKYYPLPTHRQKKKRIKTTSATEMPFRDCLLSLPPCCSWSLLAATRLSVVSGWLDLDILEFENHLLLFRPPFMSPTSTAWSSSAWSSCSWWHPPWILSL